MALADTILATQPARLKAYYPCDELAGTTLADASGNGFDLELTGSGFTLGVAGQVGDAVSFDGIDGHARGSFSVLGANPSAFTLLALVKGGPNQAATPVSLGNIASANPFLRILTGVGPTARGHWRNNTGVGVPPGGTQADFLTKSAGIAFDDFQWHLVMYRQLGGLDSIWVDDLKVYEASHSATGTYGFDRTALGALIRNTTSQFFNGSMQHAAFWDVGISDAEYAAIFAETGIVPFTTGPYSTTLIDRSADLGTANAQGVAYDGTHVYFSDSTTLYKYAYDLVTGVGALVLSRVVSGDDPVAKTQINGMDFFNGSLWVGANNHNATPKLGWIIEYDPANLTRIATHPVGANWNEGGAWKDGDFWAIYHDLGAVRRYDAAFSLIAQYDLPFTVEDTSILSERGLYQGGQWFADDFLTPMHKINPDNCLHIHRWNGTGFDRVQIVPIYRDLGQDVGQGPHWETVGTRMLFAERVDGVSQHVVRALMTVPGAGFGHLLSHHRNRRVRA